VLFRGLSYSNFDPLGGDLEFTSSSPFIFQSFKENFHQGGFSVIFRSKKIGDFPAFDQDVHS
jgi:hypothetical protein